MGSAYRVHGFNVAKRRLVESLSAGIEHLVVQGEVIDANDRILVRKAGSDEPLVLETRAVVVSAGCGTKRLLRNVFGLGEPTLAKISYTRPHMICVRGPEDVLPPIGTVLSPEVIVVGHRDTDADASQQRLVTWYVTPAETGSALYDAAPDDGAADVERSVVTSGIEALVRLFPTLGDHDERVEATVFAGFKQAFDGVPTKRACNLIEAEGNLLMVLPSVLANAVPNAMDAVSILRNRLQEPRGLLAEAVGSGPVAVGQLNEHRDNTRWATWSQFADEYARLP